MHSIHPWGDFYVAKKLANCRTGWWSISPAGLLAPLTAQQAADSLAFLMTIEDAP
jgi:hypothetical protein